MDVFGINIPLWMIIIVVLLYLLYRHNTRHFGLFKSLGIKGRTPYPFIGTMLTFFKKGLMAGDMEARKLYGKVFGTFLSSQPCLVVFDTDMLKQIMVKNFSSFQNRRVGAAAHPLDKMLTMIKDDHWKHVRNTLTPGFSGSKLRRMTHWINKAARDFRDNLGEKAKKGEVFDLKTSAGEYTMDVIAGTAFSMDVNSQKDPNNQFIIMAKKSFTLFDKFSLRLLLLFIWPSSVKYFEKLNYHIFPPKDVVDFFVGVVDNAMKTRKGNDEKHAMDFLDIMMHVCVDPPDGSPPDNADLVKEDSGLVWSKTGLTRGDILAQSFLFFVAGYETTATTLAYLGYNLACNPDIQERLLTEIDSVVAQNEEIDYDMTKKMTYLDMCMDETLRLYPAAVRVDRMTEEDVNINGLPIPKGVVIGIPIYGLHHDPELWEDPEKFIPERFTSDAKAERDPFSYMPFGMGPRNCIGMRLAKLELRIAAAQVLRRYKFVKCDQTEIPIKMKMASVAPVNGIMLRMEAREDVGH